MKMNSALNSEAALNPSYFASRNGTLLESDVFEVVKDCAKGTKFEGSIVNLVSGSAFPDITIEDYVLKNRLYGVEVKSTKENHWKTIGSSILESSRIKNVDRIFLCFGKLGSPVEFKTRKYEDCLSGISVTHYPRYQIDMDLKNGETIFDKIGVGYDVIRNLENPVPTVAKYYKSRLKSGESLWWASNPEDEAVSATVRLWSVLSVEEKDEFVAKACVYFPEIFGSNLKKYNRYALWLATQNGVIDTNVRDDFSAGGKVDFRLKSGLCVKIPAVFGKIDKFADCIKLLLLNTEEDVLKSFWNVDSVSDDRILQWCRLVFEMFGAGKNESGTMKKILIERFEIDERKFDEASAFNYGNGLLSLQDSAFHMGVFERESKLKVDYKIEHK